MSPAARRADSRAKAWPARIAESLSVTLLANHYPPLHGLRVLAIILVVQLHLTIGLAGAGLIAPSGGWFHSDDLWFAMDLFFLLSGFLIGSMLLSESPAGRRVAVGRFYLRRSFRIVPSYFVVLTALALFTPLNPVQRGNLWREYAYLTNYVPPTLGTVVMPWGWSLALEEHFYLVVPLLVGALRSMRSERAQLVVLALLWLSAPLLRTWVYVRGAPWTSLDMLPVFYCQTHLRFDILVAGIFTACVQRFHGASLAEQLTRRPRRRLFGAVSAAAFLVLVCFGYASHSPPASNILSWGTFTSVAYVPLVLLLLNSNTAASRVLSRPSFALLAALGYGTYLVHVPVIVVVVVPVAAWVSRFAHVPEAALWVGALTLAFGIATFVSYLIHLVVEKPALWLRDRLTP